MSLRDLQQGWEPALPSRKKKAFLVPLTADIVVTRGRAQLLGTQENFYGVTPPSMPAGWKISVSENNHVPRKAEIFPDEYNRHAWVNLDKTIFSDPEIPEGCKIFMVFHEIGHLKHGHDEAACDEFAFYHALRAGVSPYLCFVALAAFMPDHYAYRIERLQQIILSNPQLKMQADELTN